MSIPAIAELLELAAHAKPLALLGEKEAHALVAGLGARVGLDQERQARAVDAVGDPGLGAVDDVGVVALAARRGADRLQVGAAVGLSQREAAAQLARGEAGQVVLALVVGAEALDGSGHDEVRVDEAAHRHPGVGEPLDDLGVGGDRQAEAAVFLGDGGAEEAHLLHLLDDVLGVDVVVLERGDVGADVALEEPLDSVEDQRFLFGIHRLGPGPPLPQTPAPRYEGREHIPRGGYRKCLRLRRLGGMSVCLGRDDVGPKGAARPPCGRRDAGSHGRTRRCRNQGRDQAVRPHGCCRGHQTSRFPTGLTVVCSGRAAAARRRSSASSRATRCRPRATC